MAVFAHIGKFSMGIKMPLINIRGRRIKLSIIMISPGFSVGNMANILPSREKDKEAVISPMNKISGLTRDTPRNNQVVIKPREDMNRLNKTPPKALPNTMA